MKNSMFKTPTIGTTSLTPTTTSLFLRHSRNPPKVFYTEFVWNAIWHLVDSSPKEIGWLGLVEPRGNDYLVTDLYIPEQTVSATETDITPEAMSALATEILASGKDPSQLRYWGHSHVNMAVRPSAQDELQLEDYLEHCDWFIRGIYNKKRETKVDVYDCNNNVVHQVVSNGTFITPLSEEDIAHLDSVIDTNVTEQIISYVPPRKSYYHQNQQKKLKHRPKPQGHSYSHDLGPSFDDDFDDDFDESFINSGGKVLPIY